MTKTELPVIPKWPFFLGDALLLGLAFWIVQRQPHPLGATPLWMVVLCVLAGCWLAVLPFLAEYRAALKLAESESLADSLTQMRDLEAVQSEIKQATGIWQEVQDACDRTVEQARGIADRMAAEAKAFTEFLQQANDTERQHLRLEVDKLRRMEGDWLQIVVRMLDHVFALHQAGQRSGQPGLAEQLTLFQDACRDIVRRVGLVAVEAKVGEPYDPERHQLAEDNQTPGDGARVAEVLATGFSYQGRLLRKPLVRLGAAADGLPQAPSPFAESARAESGEAETDNAETAALAQTVLTSENQAASPAPSEETTSPPNAEASGAPQESAAGAEVEGSFSDDETTVISASELNAATEEEPFTAQTAPASAEEIPSPPSESDDPFAASAQPARPSSDETFDPFAEESVSSRAEADPESSASAAEPPDSTQTEEPRKTSERSREGDAAQSGFLFDS